MPLLNPASAQAQAERLAEYEQRLELALEAALTVCRQLSGQEPYQAQRQAAVELSTSLRDARDRAHHQRVQAEMLAAQIAPPPQAPQATLSILARYLERGMLVRYDGGWYTAWTVERSSESDGEWMVVGWRRFHAEGGSLDDPAASVWPPDWRGWYECDESDSGWFGADDPVEIAQLD